MSDNNKKQIVMGLGPGIEDLMAKSGYDLEDPNSPLKFAIEQAESVVKKAKAPALAFTENVSPTENYMGLYKAKTGLLPDDILKQIRHGDHLVAAILRARGSHISLFGHLRKDRFDIGLEIEIKQEFYKLLSKEELEKVNQRIKKVEQMLLNCGKTEGLENQDRNTLAEFLDVQVRNGLTFGRFATEIIYDRSNEPVNGKFPFFRFRAVDAGTIYRAAREDDAEGTSLRKQAIGFLKSINKEDIRIDVSKLEADDYAWYQMLQGQPRQAFTHDEMLVFNLYPSTDVEHNGYPVTPLDTSFSSVTTHISIDTYTRLYFQNGRAAKGMLVIQSDEVDESIISGIKMQFNAAINNVSNAFRTPIFGMGKDDKVDWVPFAGEGANDMEFQFLYDQTARNILASFSISPDELPGYTHLSKGTNSQTLSECLSPESWVMTPLGRQSLKGILNGHQEAYTVLWNGTEFVYAKVFMTGPKDLKKTTLFGGLSIETSPDHRFLTLGSSGDPEWKEQSELKIGDYVLINKQEASLPKTALEYKGKAITPELMEVLGWIAGDGTIVAPKKRAGGYIKMYYHHSKEPWILDRHLEILKSFGINCKKTVQKFTDIEVNAIKEKYGFKSVSNERIGIIGHDTDFVRFLISLGFNTSIQGKNIPDFIFGLPTEFKGSYLKGLFSADGHINKASKSVWLTVSDVTMRESVRELLITLGIKTIKASGTTKELIKGNKRETVPFHNKLGIQSKREFFKKVGFLQPHKQIIELNGSDIINIPYSTQLKYVTLLINSELPRKYKRDLYCFVNGNTKKRVSLNRIVFLLGQAGLQIPKWMLNYNVESVRELSDLNKRIDMADVTVYEDSHAFVANGIIVHNSSNEFKLTASRDTGLRPLVLKIQTFFNQRLFPIIDPLLAKICDIKFAGLDAQSKEQESARLQQDMPTFMTYDEVLYEVDKDPIGKEYAGTMPFNERYQTIADKFLEVGKLQSKFMGDPTASTDSLLKYRRDPFWLQYIQLMAQANPGALKALLAPKPYALDILKMEVEDYLEEEEE